MRIVVSCPNWIGDAVMATPALVALRQLFPDTHLALVARPYVAAVFDPAPYADEILLWGRPGGMSTGALAHLLRRQHHDLGVLLANSFRSALLFFLGGVGRRVGYAREFRAALLTDRLTPPRADGRCVPTPALGYYFELVRLLGAAEPPPRMQLFTTPEDEAAADGLFSALGLVAERTLIMAPGAAFGAAKCWPAERFAAVARRAHDELQLRTLILCAPQELPVAEAIAAESRGAAVFPPPPLPTLRTAKALVRRARAMLTNDSGLRHFAAAYDVPVVAIFGPTHIQWTETWFAKETKLQAAVPCGPCQKRVCPAGHLRCMMETTPEQVLAALAEALAKFPYQPPSAETIIQNRS